MNRKERTPEGGGIAGFIFGLLLSALVFMCTIAFIDVPWPALAVISIAVGILGYIYGDRFWYWLMERLWWVR